MADVVHWMHDRPLHPDRWFISVCAHKTKWRQSGITPYLGNQLNICLISLIENEGTQTMLLLEQTSAKLRQLVHAYTRGSNIRPVGRTSEWGCAHFRNCGPPQIDHFMIKKGPRYFQWPVLALRHEKYTLCTFFFWGGGVDLLIFVGDKL
jgi:hypothetical protein